MAGIEATHRDGSPQETVAGPGPRTANEISNGPIRLLDLSSNPTTRLLQAPNRDKLQDSYFTKFHPHWPVLHEHTFKTTQQPDGLRQAVLTIGLWMLKEKGAREEARYFHDTLVKHIDIKLVREHPILLTREMKRGRGKEAHR